MLSVTGYHPPDDVRALPHHRAIIVVENACCRRSLYLSGLDSDVVDRTPYLYTPLSQPTPHPLVVFPIADAPSEKMRLTRQTRRASSAGSPFVMVVSRCTGLLVGVLSTSVVDCTPSDAL